MDLIDDNYKCINKSFLYYLHERDLFDLEKIVNLCDYIVSLDQKDEETILKLFFIQNQIMKHIIYHFDPKDMSTISNLPKNHMDYILKLEDSINKYLKINDKH
ncbi:MAG: hypothetical protein HDR19_05500 [Lachnospiraceae bacterium]|nr:hypothetical protein [Lachnospiraceae bacterium]